MTAPATVKVKWRPGLALIVYAVLLTVMAMPVLIVFWFRITETVPARISEAETGALFVVIALTLTVAYVLTRAVTAPINALIIRTEKIARGGKSAIEPLESYGTREIATLSQSFLDLATKLVDRTDYIRSFAAHVSHELKSPLTAIKGAAELLRDEDIDQPMSAAQRLRFLDNIVFDVERLDLLLSRLRELAEAEVANEQGMTDLADVLDMLRSRFPHLTINGDGDMQKMIALPLEALNIVFSNLADNAVQHGATIVELRATAQARMMTILFRDNGSGISSGNRKRIFQPFFSTRREAGGTGMGLEIVRTMLGSYAGTIRLCDTTPGTEFEIRVPCSV